MFSLVHMLFFLDLASLDFMIKFQVHVKVIVFSIVHG